MALFASHFIYRYGSIDTNFGEKYTSGCKFSILFFIPIITGIWWSTVVRVWFWPNTQMDEYTRNLIMETVGVGIENISYIGAKFYNQENGNLTSHFNTPAWIGVAQMWFMVNCFAVYCVARKTNTEQIRLPPFTIMVRDHSHKQ
ncbi:unnamed protein product [Caenorhabditis nigoni]